MDRRRVVVGAAALLGLTAVGMAYHREIRDATRWLRSRWRGRRTVGDVLASHGPAARARLVAQMAGTGTAYPPAAVTMIGLKAERRLEVWVSAGDGPRWIASHGIVAASGGPGPKLREGDRQVPEGVYPITFLNANSRYYLSLRIGYPNRRDRAHAAREGRDNLGGDIMIHGPGGSIGCLALRQQAVAELFVLAADVGLDQVRILLAPHDFRARGVPEPAPDAPRWLAARYRRLAREMAPYRTVGT